MRAGLVTKVMEHINILVNEWFSGIKPELIIPCPYCMVSRPHTTANQPIHLHRAFSSNTVLQSLTSAVIRGGEDEDVSNAYVFSFDDCVWQSRNFSVIYCPAHGDVPLEFFVPDVVHTYCVYLCLVYACVCLYVRVFLYVCVCMRVCLYVCMLVCVCLYV